MERRPYTPTKGKAAMTGTNIPEGTESLTRGDYDKLRDQAGIVADARLHDMRHTHVSHAIMNGEPAPSPTGSSAIGIQARQTATLSLTT